MSDTSNLDSSSQEPVYQAIFGKELDRIAALLHDDVLQTFGSCVLKAQLCERLVQKGQYALVEKELGLLLDRLNSAIDSVRHLVSTLERPPSG